MQGQKPKRSDPNQIRLTPGSIFQLFSWNAEAFFVSFTISFSTHLLIKSSLFL